ncbi:MAG: 7-cyano-7-deazaguanine synthase QueC [Syntrophobacteraceae bacterium]|nr:7-cyano-7-deazaguanine synthase QueC [Syntrophobacteraceae bacterium]
MTEEAPRSKAVILLSGGVDSTTCLAVAKAHGFIPHTIAFDYGQRHRAELEAAARVAAAFGVARHLVLEVPLGLIGGSALTTAMQVPKGVAVEEMARRIPVTYVPARNTVFLSLALAWSEVIASGDIFIGVNALDYSGYPDCRPEYIRAFEEMANLATRQAVEGRIRLHIHTPLIHLTKAGIIQLGRELGVDYRLTHSCYDPDVEGRACGLCDSCQLRRKGFAEAGVPDPTEYVP